MKEVYKYAIIKDITDYVTTLELSYQDYADTNLVAIYKNGHIYYYLEVLVPEDITVWGKDELVDFI